jgi:hypothetical protein
LFADDRLTRLRTLVAELERLPASPERAWMIAEARARMVDVETGERPRGALRSLAEHRAAGRPRQTAAEAGASPVDRAPSPSAEPADGGETQYGT